MTISQPTAMINDEYQPQILKGSAKISGAISYYPSKGVHIKRSPIASPNDQEGYWVENVPALLREIKETETNFDLVNALDAPIVGVMYGNSKTPEEDWIKLLYGCEKRQIVNLLERAVSETVTGMT